MFHSFLGMGDTEASCDFLQADGWLRIWPGVRP